MRITVNHLTRMKPPYVCVAGIDAAGRSIRPVLSSERIPRSLLANSGGPFQLGAVVDLASPRPRPVIPEVEDVGFESRRTRQVEQLDGEEFAEVLDGMVGESLRSIFGPTFVRKSKTAAAVPQHTGIASLGVLTPGEAQLKVETRYEKPQVRVHFADPVFGDMTIKVTDLRLWEEDQVTPATRNIEKIEDELDGCYLAVGLSRAFAVPSYEGTWHWLQVNNVFPVDDPLWVRE